MNESILRGWNLTLRHRYVLIVLFLYRLLWGFFLFRFIDGIVTPILARYPDDHPNADAIPLFWAEAEFRLLKTDLINAAAWTAAALVLVRLLVTPTLQAGLFHSFRHARQETGTRVLEGIRRFWKTVVPLYWLEIALTALPGVWIAPRVREAFFGALSLADFLVRLLPYAIAWLVWWFALHLAIRSLQFGAVSRTGSLRSLSRTLRRAPRLAAVTLAMAGLGLGLSAVSAAVAHLWAGLAAVVIHQAFHLVRVTVQVWTAAAQYAVWAPEDSPKAG